MPDPIVISGPIIEPITLTEAKAHCRIDTSDNEQDALIEGFIAAARDYIEWRAGITAHEKTLQLNLDCWPDGPINLPGATPLIAVSSVTYYDSTNTPTVWSSAEYATSTGSKRKLGRIAPNYGHYYPVFTPYALDPIRIVYRAGIVTASPLTDAEETLKQAVRELVGRMYDIREAEVVTDRATIEAKGFQYGLEGMLARLRVEFAF